MNESQLNQALNAANAALGQVSNTIGAANLDKINRKFAVEQAEKQREWNEAMWSKTNAWNYEMWKETNAYNTPEAQLQRLRDAGLNPLYYGLDGSSANGLEASQPLGYDRADYNSTINPIGVGLDTQIAMRSMQKDLELKNAQIDKIKEDTKSTGLDNEWKDKTMEARVEAEQISNNLSKEQIKEVRKKIDVMEQDIKKKVAETDSEIERKNLLIAEKALKEASEQEILSLLPYRILLTQAQTQSEQADAALKWTQQAYQQGIIDSGYIDFMAEEMQNSAKLAGARVSETEAQAAIAEFKAAVKNGTAISFEGKSLAGRVFAVTGNAFLRSVSQLSEALGGSLVPLVGAGLLGKGLGKAGTTVNVPSASNPNSHGSYTVLYGPDGKSSVTNSW